MIAINQIGHGEGSAISAGSQHTPLMAPETIRQEVEVPHSNFPNETPVADEAPFIGVDVVHGGAAATVSSIDACGKLVGRIEANKITYGAAFTKLIKKVKKLEQTVKTSQAKRRANIVVSDDEDNKEDPSKQGRSMIEEMDLDARISLVPPHVEVQRRYGQNLETQEGFGYGQEVSTAVQVSTAGPEATTPDAELNIASTFIKKSAAKAKGKANMDETESLRKREQLQAGEKCSEEDLPMKLIELVNQRKKFFAQQRAKAKRNKPMTHAQQKEYIYQITSRTKKERLKRAGQEVLEEPIKRQKIGEASGLDSDDTLWKLQRYMHDPLVWRLYDACGVHHVSSVRGHYIFMLVEKDYPLSKGVQMLMLVNKLLVKQHSEMANKLGSTNTLDQLNMLVYPDIQYVGSSSIELEGVYSACVPVGKGQPHIVHVKLEQGGLAAPLLARDTKTELEGFTYVNEVVKIRVIIRGWFVAFINNGEETGPMKKVNTNYGPLPLFAMEVTYKESFRDDQFIEDLYSNFRPLVEKYVVDEDAFFVDYTVSHMKL
ncbi:hypothetical protein Tco_1061109 [Tanacetum coccineum]